MLGIDKRAARAAWTVLLVVLAAFLVYLIRRTLLVFIVALLLAYLLTPLVNMVDRMTPRRFSRVLSLALVYLLLLGLLGLTGGVLGERIRQEAVQLADNVPGWLKGADPLANLPVPAWLEAWKTKAVAAIRTEIESNAGQLVPLLGHAGQGILSWVGNLAFVVLIPILSFLFLKDGAAIRMRILNLFAGHPKRGLVDDVLSDVHVLLGQFMRALVILAAATLVVYGGFFLVVGLPYAILLAAVAAALEFIPMIGPLSAGVGIVLVAILSGNAGLAVWLVLFLLGYRLFQDYVLQPYLMSSGVELHPLWVIFGVLAGEQIGGVGGMFLSIPTLAILRVIYVRILKARHITGSPYESPPSRQTVPPESRA
jgi:predicted PurR-regulated permease PerM